MIARPPNDAEMRRHRLATLAAEHACADEHGACSQKRVESSVSYALRMVPEPLPPKRFPWRSTIIKIIACVVIVVGAMIALDMLRR